jgi:hypothetical protein
MATDDPTAGQTMITVPQADFRALPYLVSLGAVGAAIVAVFFGVGLFLLVPRHPTAPPADPDPLAQALESLDLPTPAINDTAPGSSSAPAAKNVAASPTLGASSSREVPTLGFTAVETTLIPPARITHAKKVRIFWYHRQVTRRAASWRPDASAGPNPGGGFYSPPNINVGYINPK